MSCNDFVHKNGLRNKTTSNTKIQKLLSCLFFSDVRKNLRDGPISRDIGLVNLNPTKGTQWVAYNNEKHFDSYGSSPPQNLSQFIIKPNGHCYFFVNIKHKV